jgi:hypothetical protein
VVQANGWSKPQRIDTSQAAEAASIGPDPGPRYIPAELIAGGRTAKSVFEPFAA